MSKQSRESLGRTLEMEAGPSEPARLHRYCWRNELGQVTRSESMSLREAREWAESSNTLFPQTLYWVEPA
jgi:hypothetical protein